MTVKTRRPSGRPPWPITLIAGAEKAGKSWSAAEASGSDLIGRTLWFGLGEDDPDEYGAVPGANFEIVEHDGTYRGFLTTLAEAVDECAPGVDGKPALLIIDSGTRLWDLLADTAQAEANRRASKKAGGRAVHEATINSDLWNLATQRWNHVLDELRRHRGPSIITARLELTTVFNDRGDPTKDKTYKVKAQKSLPFDVGAIVQMPARGEAWLTGVRSVRNPQTEERVRLRDFTVDALWRHLGLADGAGDRRHTGAVVEGDDTASEPVPPSPAEVARAELLRLCQERQLRTADVAQRYFAAHGTALGTDTDADRIRAFAEKLATGGGGAQ